MLNISWLYDGLRMWSKGRIGLVHRPMGPMFNVRIGQNLWVMDCPAHDWGASIYWHCSSMISHVSHLYLDDSYGDVVQWVWGYSLLDVANISCADRTDPMGLGIYLAILASVISHHLSKNWPCSKTWSAAVLQRNMLMNLYNHIMLMTSSFSTFLGAEK